MQYPRKLRLFLVPLALWAQSAFATILLTDNFTATQNDQNVQGQNLAARLGGTLAPGLILNGAAYTAQGPHHQMGNPETEVGQSPVGGPYNKDYLLLAFNGSVQALVDIAAQANSASAPLQVIFDMYVGGNGSPTRGDTSNWGAFTLRGAGSDSWPVVGSGEFGFLIRENGGVQVFQNGASIAPAGWDTLNFAGFSSSAASSHWIFTFSDTAGTGSAFNGNGSLLTVSNGSHTETLSLSQLNASNLQVGFRNYDNRFAGIDNLAIATVPEPAGAVLLLAAGMLGLQRRSRRA